MTEKQMKMIEEMSNEKLVRTYERYAIMNDKELNLSGVKYELQEAMFKEILKRMNKEGE